jgi:RNA methyltransferase, TrmH family|tara:strand:- start:412 stop:1131 length:720 start_codon:yes stop_codon:yes gene_type:complete
LPSKAKLKLYQQLNSKKFRQKYGLFVVEGLKSVNELTQSNWPVETILCTPAFLERYGEQIDFTFDLISSEEFAATSHLINPQEILAIAKFHDTNLPTSPWQIALDGINDPGNLGTIIRIADWYGINTIYCSENTVEFYNSKVIQSTMGSFLRVKVIEGNLGELLAGKDVYATLLDGKNIRTMDKPTEGVLLIGNEANGIDAATLEAVRHTGITIPGIGHTESLNAAMATAICCERLVGE